MQGDEKLDQVIREFPVFLSKSFDGQLYVIQYPLLPITVSPRNGDVKQAKIKPKQDKIQLTIPLDPTVRYNKRKENRKKRSSSDAIAVDSSSSEGSSDEGSNLNNESGDHPPEREQTMESHGIPNSSKSARYVIGVVRNGGLHFSPIKSIVEMRDILPYLDKTADDDLKAMNSETEEATKVNVRFSQTREFGFKKKAKSHSYSNRQNENETWIDLRYRGQIQDSSKVLRKMCAGEKGESEMQFYYFPQKDYLGKIFPRDLGVFQSGCRDKSTNAVARVPYSEIKNMSVQDQLRQVLVYGKVLRYSEVKANLKNRFGVHVDDVSLLRAIQTVAVLVQGCWAVKSDLLYPLTYVSNSNGIHGREMQRARDVILGQFNDHCIVQRKRMCTLTRLPNDEVTEILQDLGVVRPKIGWEFVKPFDTDFVETCREVVQRQNVMWELKRANRDRPPEAKSSSTSSASSISPTRISKSIPLSNDTDSVTVTDFKKTPKSKSKPKRSQKKK